MSVWKTVYCQCGAEYQVKVDANAMDSADFFCEVCGANVYAQFDPEENE